MDLTLKNKDGFRCGLVALAGLPNAGKSTLLNALLGEKISIISNKPQTTRNAIQGIKTTENYQIVFVDTPGYHAGRGRLNKAMVQQAEDVILSVDLVCVLADAKERGGESFKNLLDKVKSSGAPAILIITKLDDRSKEDLFKAAERLGKMYPFQEIIPISAKTGANLVKLEELIIAELPEQPAVYSADELTTQPAKFLISEFIREQAFKRLQQELPYDILVETEEVTEQNGRMEITASIIVARDSQKGIVIGRGGAMLKEIGTNARLDLEKFFGVNIRLDLFVKVKENWSSKDEYLRIQGL